MVYKNDFHVTLDKLNSFTLVIILHGMTNNIYNEKINLIVFLFFCLFERERWMLVLIIMDFVLFKMYDVRKINNKCL